MDARGPVTAQRVPMAAGMPGPVPHNMGANPPPPARPVRPTCHVFVCAGCLVVAPIVIMKSASCMEQCP